MSGMDEDTETLAACGCGHPIVDHFGGCDFCTCRLGHERALAAHDARVRAEALAPIGLISGHTIAAAIYSGGGAVHPDASDRVLTLLRAAMEAKE